MIKLSELQIKEVIIIDNGRKLGHINDLEIDTTNGRILAIVIIPRDKKSGLFGKAEELVIHWNQIVRIGSDVILVKDVEKPKLYNEPFIQERK
ncbi:MAG: YlmC/YmxH family sporulation protein [Bacillota bacterium]|uniref:YlmC/YmxH family sporulation protein n=1 Tax=Virgibacillus TaxID=84406 RepID=UPI000424A760|nr:MULTISPECIES: YlmC/YmxH family sporulation protein [Bacillaceae]MCC2249596.1 YlmC/YmxH family sporulation protein [Virgibacillus sp. AGTR]MDY7044176.1 YlmC/YmxH family sporulation protein [Virgibacillus sp. M23]QRZ16880.1 YlmC/YmxH family sporulation protein [Virgibacillus sp. AGTR]WBX79645.1 YlmC/YmxH family sporulation protein [Virgibacillus salarius]